MNLSDLNVVCVSGVVVNGRSTSTLSFDCPKCKVPNRIYILVSDQMDEANSVWKMTLPQSGDVTLITVEPSIHNHYHEKMKPCGWHGEIRNGVVQGS